MMNKKNWKMGTLARAWLRKDGIEVDENWLEHKLRNCKTFADELVACVEIMADDAASQASRAWKEPDVDKSSVSEFLRISRMLMDLAEEARSQREST